jgi:hypothetical protein
MHKALVAFTSTVPLALLGWGVWVAEANSLSSALRPLSQNHFIEQIGCKGGPSPEDRCPYGYRIERHGGGSWFCEPCWQQRYGSRYRDGEGGYYEPRRYRGYGDYESRHYREYNDGYYEPRRYREY